MQYLYVPEMKQPNYNEIKHKVPAKPCQNFNKFFLSNGKAVALKSQEQQQEGINKLYIEDWRRKGYGYDTTFEGEMYHLVKDRERSKYHIEKNERESQFVGVTKQERKAGFEPTVKYTLKFENQVGRKDKDYILPLCDSRFDLINKSPSVISSMTHIP